MHNIDGLTAMEKELLIRVCMQKWTPEDRQFIARTLPEVYAKLTGTNVAVDTGAKTLVITSKF